MMKDQVAELIGMYTMLLDTFEQQYADEVCASLARLTRKMYNNLVLVGFTDEQAVALLCSMANRFQSNKGS